MSKAISSNSFRMIFRAFITTRRRSRNDAPAHSCCASRARPTARATSSGITSGARPISSPVAGSREMSSALSDLAGMLWAIAGDYRAESELKEDQDQSANRYDHPPATAGGTDFSLSATIRLQSETIEEIRMLKPQLVDFMRRMDTKSVAIIPAAREAVRS